MAPRKQPRLERAYYPPRGMRADNAAAYVGMSQASFFRLVEDGLLPKPIRVRGMVLWDRHDLDGWFDDLKHEEQPRNTMHDILGIADGS